MNRSRVIAPVLALLATIAYVPPAGAAVGGNTGGTVNCAAGPPQTIATYQTAQPVDASVVSSGGISCPTQQNQSPGSFGPPNTKPVNVPPPTPGTPCQLSYDTPVQFRLAGSNPEYRVWSPPAITGTKLTVDPNNPGFQPSIWTNLFTGFGVTLSMYEQAGSTDFFIPTTFTGLWNATSQCEATQGPGTGWVAPCLTNAVCFDSAPPPVPVVGGPIGAPPIDLNGLVQGRFTGGQISSMPAHPNPGLVNYPACFYVTGMTINGAVGDPQQDHFWEQIVPGPEITEGRHIYYVLLVRVFYQQTVWDFGDGTTLTIPGGGASPETPPAQCGNVPGQQFLVAHTYKHYSTGGGFQVTVTHQFGVDVTEMWWDAASPPAHVLQFPNAVPPVPVVAANQPYVMPIVQEEGVPVG